MRTIVLAQEGLKSPESMTGGSCCGTWLVNYTATSVMGINRTVSGGLMG